MAPASIIEINKESINKKIYWHIDDIKPISNINLQELKARCLKLLRQAVKRQLSCLPQVDLLLSGGHDSRCLAALVSEHNSTIFSHTTQKEFGNRGDEIISKLIAKKLNIKNDFFNLPSNMYQKNFLKYFLLMEGLTDEHFWLMPLINNLKSSIPIIDGLCGDIIFGKTYIHQNEIDNFINNQDYHNLALAIINRRKGRKIIFDNMLDKYFHEDIASEIKKAILNSLSKELKEINNEKNIISLFLIKNKIRRGVALAPLKMIYEKKDCILPFLDNDLMEFMLSINQGVKLESNFYDNIINIINQSLSDIPYQSDNHNLPIPPRSNYPHQTNLANTYIKELFSSFNTSEFLKKPQEDFIYPNSKYVHFHLWYNIFYKNKIKTF